MPDILRHIFDGHDPRAPRGLVTPGRNQHPDLYGENSIDEAEALSILTPEEREVLVLYVYAGFRQTEITSILHMTYGEVRSHYGYALKKLKRHYTLQGGMKI